MPAKSVTYNSQNYAGTLGSGLVCNACIIMPRLDIDTSSRVVSSRVFLKSSGYSVSQIKNRHRQTILISTEQVFLLAFNQLTGQT